MVAHQCYQCVEIGKCSLCHQLCESLQTKPEARLLLLAGSPCQMPRCCPAEIKRELLDNAERQPDRCIHIPRIGPWQRECSPSWIQISPVTSFMRAVTSSVELSITASPLHQVTYCQPIMDAADACKPSGPPRHHAEIALDQET